MRMRKRSSCDSGSANVPSWSCGFCVAITKKGEGRARVSPSTVTWRSSIASSSALWVFGLARMENESFLSTLVDRHARQVAGHQVGGELHAREVQAERAGERVGERRLAH